MRNGVALLVVFGLLCGFREPFRGAYEGTDTEAVDVSLAHLDGTSKALSRAVGGWTLLKFGTTRCPRCDDQIRELNTLAPFLEAEAVEVIEIFLREPPDAVRNDLENNPRFYRTQILLDPRGDSIVLYGLRLIPRLFLVDPQGTVRLDTSYLEATELKERISRAMDRQG